MTTFTVETIEPQAAAVIRAEVFMAELRGVFDRAFPEIMRVAGEQSVAIAGPPFGFYPRMPTDTVEVVVGFPVASPIAAEGDVEPFELPGTRVITGVHVGPYEGLGRTYEELTAWARAEGHELGPAMWESYVSDPSAQPDPATWETKIAWPIL